MFDYYNFWVLTPGELKIGSGKWPFCKGGKCETKLQGGCRTGNVGLITDNIAEMENVGLENAWSCMISFVHFQSLIFQSSIFPTTRHHHLFGYYFSTDCNGRPFYLLFWWSVRDVSTSMNSFSGRLKAELFHRAYGTDLSPMWQLSVISLSEHKYSFFLSLTYLLTYLQNSFSRRLKAELFHRAYRTELAPMWQLSVNSLCEHKYSYLLTYLLTYSLTYSTERVWTAYWLVVY